jgi:hypothetical protein
MSIDKIMCRCDIYSSEYQMGPHVYNGKYIRQYEINTCMSCYRANWDGWAPY